MLLLGSARFSHASPFSSPPSFLYLLLLSISMPYYLPFHFPPPLFYSVLLVLAYTLLSLSPFTTFIFFTLSAPALASLSFSSSSSYYCFMDFLTTPSYFSTSLDLLFTFVFFSPCVRSFATKPLSYHSSVSFCFPSSLLAFPRCRIALNVPQKKSRKKLF